MGYCSNPDCGRELTTGTYRVHNNNKYCLNCFKLGFFLEDDKESYYPEVLDEQGYLSDNLARNPLLRRVMISEEDERDKRFDSLSRIGTLQQLNEEIARNQEISAALAKHADILHVPKVDKFNNILLESMTGMEGEEKLKSLVDRTLTLGDAKDLRMLLAAFKDLNDVRETWLSSFDVSRQSNQRKQTRIAIKFGNVGIGVDIQN